MIVKEQLVYEARYSDRNSGGEAFVYIVREFDHQRDAEACHGLQHNDEYHPSVVATEETPRADGLCIFHETRKHA